MPIADWLSYPPQLYINIGFGLSVISAIHAIKCPKAISFLFKQFDTLSPVMIGSSWCSDILLEYCLQYIVINNKRIESRDLYPYD